MSTIYRKIIDTIFPQPRICPICGEKQTALEICASCMSKLETEKHLLGQCKRCGTFGVNTDECSSCCDWPRNMTNQAGIPYKDEYRNYILELKFQEKPWLANAANQLLPTIKDNVDFITAVPLSKDRKYERGYNQSELLAKIIAQNTNKPFERNILTKIREVPPQSTLNRAERLKNLNHAFYVQSPKKVEGKSILLVDDIITTGTTLKVCGELLYQAGAKNVVCITLAAGIAKDA